MKQPIDETSVHLQRNQWNMREVWYLGLKIASNGEFRSTPYSAQTAQLEMVKLILVVAIFQAMQRSFDMVIPLAEVLLQSGLDLLTLQLGAEHPQACDALRGLRTIC
jgi:hypothetical protein